MTSSQTRRILPVPNTPKSKPTLARDLGVSHASAIVVGTIIGSGIFLVPAEMMQAVGSARLVYLAWIVGGMLSLAGAITYAELGAMKPQAGGEYVYIRDAYGPLPGFLYAWTWFAIAKPASIATLTIGFVRILGTFPALAFLNREAVRRAFAISYGQLVAIAAAMLITALNYIGIKRAGEFQAGVHGGENCHHPRRSSLLGFSAATGTWHNFATIFPGATGGFAGFMAALIAALWAYDGWNDLNMVSGEVRDPERNIPIALIAGVGVVAVLYMLTNAAVQYVLPASAIAASPRPASDATAVAVGAWGAAIVSAGMALSMLVALNGTIMSGARVPFAMARDGYFFQGAGRGASAVSHAVGGAAGAARAVDRSAAVCGKFPPAFLAGHLCRVAVLHDCGQHGFRVAQTGAERPAAVSDLGISRGAGDVHRGRGGAAVLHVHGEPAELGVGRGGDSGGRADLLVLRAEAREARGQRLGARG